MVILLFLSSLRSFDGSPEFRPPLCTDTRLSSALQGSDACHSPMFPVSCLPAVRIALICLSSHQASPEELGTARLGLVRDTAWNCVSRLRFHRCAHHCAADKKESSTLTRAYELSGHSAVGESTLLCHRCVHCRGSCPQQQARFTLRVLRLCIYRAARSKPCSILLNKLV